ncbi:4Fe-4S dicluster domain-containing protein [Candidatus Bathyarchaeota archaeon]|nr:4Fe-4S dicluster domain-containing protein [Candidatus Bathyarchaeota archaeon]
MSLVKGVFLNDSQKLGGRNVASWRVKRPIIDNSRCVGCKLCISYCPEAAIKHVENRVKIDYRFCKGCGICVNECPVKAITLVKER